MASNLLGVTAVIPDLERCPAYRARDAETRLAWVPKAIGAIEDRLRQPVGLLAFPAGFFAVESFSGRALQELSEAVFEARIAPAVVTVVDAENHGASCEHLKRSYGVAMLKGSILGTPVQQTSWTGAEGRAVRAEDVQDESRIHQIGGISLGLLCCGEIFSPRVKSALTNRSSGAVINMAHRSMEGHQGIKTTWCKYLKGISSRTRGWSLFAGASTDPERAEYNYYQGSRAEPVYRCCIADRGIVLRCFQLNQLP